MRVQEIRIPLNNSMKCKDFFESWPFVWIRVQSSLKYIGQETQLDLCENNLFHIAKAENVTRNTLPSLSCDYFQGNVRIYSFLYLVCCSAKRFLGPSRPALEKLLPKSPKSIEMGFYLIPSQLSRTTFV